MINPTEHQGHVLGHVALGEKLESFCYKPSQVPQETLYVKAPPRATKPTKSAGVRLNTKLPGTKLLSLLKLVYFFRWNLGLRYSFPSCVSLTSLAPIFSDAPGSLKL